MAKRSRRREQRDEEKVKLSAQESRAQIQFLIQFFKPYKLQVAFALFLLLITSGIGILFPKLTGMLLDVMLGNSQFISLGGPTIEITRFGIGSTIFGLLIWQSVIRYFSSMLMVRITENSIASLRTKVYSHILRLSMGFFGERRVGELSSRISSDLTQVQETFNITVIELIRQIIFLIAGVIFLMLISVKLTVIILATLPFLIIAGILFGKKVRQFSTKTQDALAESATIVEETLQGITSVKSFANEKYEINRYNSALLKTVSLAIRGARIRSAFVSFIMFALFGGIAGVILYAGTLVQSGEMTIGQLTSFMMYAMFVGGSLGSFAELFGQVQKTLGSAVRIQEILKEKPEIEIEETTETRLRSVVLNEVNFSYPSRSDMPVLKSISLTIAPGERVAFVGESGAGKSTVASIIQRFYEPQSGEILYDGISSKELSIQDVRQNIGTVPQDIVLFGGTIGENIRYGKLGATDDEVWRAAELANAANFIKQFPEGLNTLVGDRGVKLSGGQRQRVAIARTILKNPPILILDEATSSLDAESEYLIQEALERLMHGRTTIIIAHRLSTVRRCDTIFVFSNGKIIESGSPLELMSNPQSHYARLAAYQFLQPAEAVENE
ncbi:MAG TPA: ABC transporter transmembrane domain-containing protein [Patescibacteria group bacterium]|nr:ABC transporter transmembrane domain-containing protein [Patescibacteria group bacterium]